MSNLLKKVKLLGDNIPWLHDFRQAGACAFEKCGIPNAKVEAWKYTKPNMFLDSDFECCVKGQKIVYQPNLPFDTYVINFINGVFTPDNSHLPDGIEVVPLIEALMFHPEIREKLGKIYEIDKHPFAALNQAYTNEGIYIHLPDNCKLDKPIVVIYHTATENRHLMCNVHNLIVLENGARAEFVEYFNYAGELKSCYFNNIVNEFYIGKNAELKHYKVQNEAFKAIHLALNNIEVKENGNYKSFCLQKGADLARNESRVFLLEAEAKTQIDAAYIMNGWATLDITTDIEHLAAKTFSEQLVKGVAGGQAKGIFQGKIHIAPYAVKTRGCQQHRALLLSDDAEIDTKPELEIFADDVQCSHGSACGQIDREQLFYMQSRGISEDDAKKMLVDAYIDEVIAKVDNEKIISWIKLLLGSDGNKVEMER